MKSILNRALEYEMHIVMNHYPRSLKERVWFILIIDFDNAGFFKDDTHNVIVIPNSFGKRRPLYNCVDLL